MGGSKRPHVNCACNLVTMCGHCHLERAESDITWALAHGYRIRRNSNLDPFTVPVVWFKQRVLLDCQGGWSLAF